MGRLKPQNDIYKWLYENIPTYEQAKHAHTVRHHIGEIFMNALTDAGFFQHITIEGHTHVFLSNIGEQYCRLLLQCENCISNTQ